MSNKTTPDPIPPVVRAAYEALVAAVEHCGLTASPVLLHSPTELPDGEDVLHSGDVGTGSRYWPECGGGGLIICSSLTEDEVSILHDRPHKAETVNRAARVYRACGKCQESGCPTCFPNQ